MEKYRIILADDHTVVREGFKKLIAGEPSFSLVAEARDGEELLTKLKSTSCDLIILDISMPNMNGLQAIENITLKFPNIKILVLTMHKSKELFKHAMKLGAVGYITKDDAFNQIVYAIRQIKTDKRYIPPDIADWIVDNYLKNLDETDSQPIEILTEIERKILKLIAEGYTNKDMADELHLSKRTCEAHRANILHKLGLKNTAGLVRFAIAKGLV